MRNVPGSNPLLPQLFISTTHLVLYEFVLSFYLLVLRAGQAIAYVDGKDKGDKAGELL